MLFDDALNAPTNRQRRQRSIASDHSVDGRTIRQDFVGDFFDAFSHRNPAESLACLCPSFLRRHANNPKSGRWFP